MSLGDYPPEPLTVAEVKALLAAADDGTLAGRRNRAMLILAWRTGLRCSEVLQLRPSDVNTAAGTVRVRFGKGRRCRTVGIDPAACDVIDAWTIERREAGIGAGLLFCTVVGQPGRSLDPRYVRALMARLGRKAGIEHRVHCHGLRHTHAVELLNEGWSVVHIQRQLGHANLGVTSVYLDHLLPAEVVELARHREWA